MTIREVFETAWRNGDFDRAKTALEELIGALAVEEQVDLAIDFTHDSLERDDERLSSAVKALLDVLPTARAHDSLLAVRVLDQLAALLFGMGDFSGAVARSREAIELAEGMEGDASSAIARLELLRDAARASKDDASASEAEARLSALRPLSAASGKRSFADRLREIARGAPAGRPDLRRQEAPDSAPFMLVPVHFATHRDRTRRSDPYDYFRSQRAGLSFGRATVSVPKKRDVGSLPKPPGKGKDRADPAKHFIIDFITDIQDQNGFVSDIRSTLEASTRREVLLFIHGYNNSFASALLRAAQLSVDLEINGATILYSWPSVGSKRSYFVDRVKTGGAVIPDIAKLIVDVATKTGARRVHLIGHSMGAEFLLDSLLEARAQHTAATGPLADEVIFASPDIDVDRFNGRIADVRHLARRITAYTSENDRALWLSSLVQGGGPRAGASAERVSLSGIDAIDTSFATRDLLGHDDYSHSAIDDVRALVWLPVEVSPAKRSAILKPDESGRFWRFHPESAIDENGEGLFRAALYHARRLGGVSAAVEHVGRELQIAHRRNESRERALKAVGEQLRAWMV